jgi:hypothetical protein
MPRSKNRPRAVTPQRSSWVDYFRWYGIPPTPLHEGLQEGARQAGWTAPWDREEQKNQKKVAGKKSGSMRAGRAKLRLLFVRAAFDRLKPAYQMQPFSDHSISALKAEYRKVVAESGDPTAPHDADLLMSASPFKADRETLIKDLKVLGIRSERRKRRSG